MRLTKIRTLLGYFSLSMIVIVAIASCSAPSPSPRASLSPQTSVNLLAHQGLVVVAQPGPWRDVNHLISYGDRLWFCNSVAGTNHNSADIYSYDPTTQDTRYEQHLFSQDAGTPMVADGLLYWPFEDPRFSADLGEYMVTNGDEWQWRFLPEGKAFHVHTMAEHQGELWAGTGAWAGGLQRSQNSGKTWQPIYSHPTPPKQVSRLTELISHNDKLYVGITALHSHRPKLFQWQDNSLLPVQGWPQGQWVKDLTSYQDWIYGINHNPDKTVSLWRTNGQTSEAITALDGYRITALATGHTALWAITVDGDNRFLWHSANGLDWTVAHTFEDVLPLDVAVHNGQVYVGGRNADNKGILLGPQSPTTPASAGQKTRSDQTALGQHQLDYPVISQPAQLSEEEEEKAIAHLPYLFSSTATYNGGDTQDTLAQALKPLALSNSPRSGSVLADALQQSFPEIKALLFEHTVEEPAADVARWYVLWAMGLNGNGKVPIDVLIAPWTTPENDREKYWQLPPAAIWTAAQVGQADATTIAALIKRLSDSSDPLWLKGDVVGALSSLTGQRLGYDIAAWQKWWRLQRVQIDY